MLWRPVAAGRATRPPHSLRIALSSQEDSRPWFMDSPCMSARSARVAHLLPYQASDCLRYFCRKQRDSVSPGDDARSSEMVDETTNTKDLMQDDKLYTSTGK